MALRDGGEAIETHHRPIYARRLKCEREEMVVYLAVNARSEFRCHPRSVPGTRSGGLPCAGWETRARAGGLVLGATAAQYRVRRSGGQCEERPWGGHDGERRQCGRRQRTERRRRKRSAAPGVRAAGAALFFTFRGSAGVDEAGTSWKVPWRQCSGGR